MGRIINWTERCTACEERTGYPHYYHSKAALKKHIKEYHTAEVVVKKVNKVKEIKPKKKRKYYSLKVETRKFVLKRDKRKCAECGSKIGLHIHHKIARKDGGSDEPENLITLCDLCHTEKHRGEGVYNIMIQNFWLYENA